jgi:hypothetical protein
MEADDGFETILLVDASILHVPCRSPEIVESRDSSRFEARRGAN